MSKSAAVFGAASRAASARVRSLRTRARRALPWALALAGAAAAGIAWWGAGRRAGSGAVLRLPLNFDPGVEVATATGSPFSLSPDGTLLAFVATKNGGAQRLFVRPLAELEAREIGGTEEAQQPFFSPDGKWVGFLAQQKLKKVSVAGGMPVPLGDVPTQMHGATWGSRGEIVISTRGALAAIAEAGGALRVIAAPDTAAGEIAQRFPRLLADGKTVLYESWSKNGLAAARIGLASLDGAKGRILDLAGSYPIGVVDGYLVYGTSPNSIMAVPFDARRGSATGAPTLVIDGAAVGTAGAMKGSLSASGALVYASSRSAEQLVITDARGVARVLLAEARHYENPRFSPDGRRVALSVQSASSADIYLFDLASGAFTRFTTEGRLNDYPEWTPDGKRVLWASNRNGASALWWGPADMSKPAERLMGSPTAGVYDGVVSADGRLLVARVEGVKGLNDLAYRSLAGDTVTKTIVSSPEPKYSPRLSPDGRWVAYSSSEVGTRQVFVTPMPGPGPRVQVSTDGGEAPAWSADGRRLYYVHAKQLIAATLAPGKEFVVASRATALDGGFNIGGQGFHANYDVSRDGTQFLVLRPVSGSVSVIFVNNWTNELRARMAASAAQ
jgi:serine/threonine-protein kinase